MMKPNITPVGTFQRITSTAPLRAETREAIQNTVLQFYIQNSQPEDDAEGLTACYERLSQEDKLDGKRRMQQTWQHILDGLCSVLRRDANIRPDAFSEQFTVEQFADILFSLMLSALLRQDYNPDAVLEIVRRILY